jgi:hypothetical protein
MPWIIAGASLIGGALASDAAGDAADAQAGSARDATALQREQWQQQRADNAPRMEAGNRSLARLQELLGISGAGGGRKSLTGADVMAEPGYQFGLQQGQQALDRQATARGMRNSGAALMAAQRYGTDYGTTKYNDAWNRMQGERTNEFNQLASVAGMGQIASNQVGAAGSQFANAAGQNMMGAANAQGAAGIAQANIWGNTGNQLAGWYANNQSRNALAGPSNAQLEAQWNGGY